MALQVVRSLGLLTLSNVTRKLKAPRSTGSIGRLWRCPRYYVSEVKTVATEWGSPTKDDIHVRSEGKYSGAEFTGKLFSEFPLSPDVLSRLQSLEMERTFEVQDKTLPLTLEGRDVIGRAITGSGKTLAFALPIVHILSKSKRCHQPRAIVITPTRELCNQVTRSVQSLSHSLKCVSIYGGDSYDRQERELARGVDVVCATPGRLNDHLQRGNLSLDNVKFLVLDEADELLTPGFLDQISNVLSDCPSDKQMMLFSATMPTDIKRIAERYMNDPVMVDLVSSRSVVPESVVHEAIKVPAHTKRMVVASLILVHKPRRVIVFTSSRADTTHLSQELRGVGIKAQPISSDLSQNARERCLENFRSGSTTVLVATDVAARGIDVPETDMVIQVDPPPSGIDFYIHRSGRTGRKGQSGRSILVLANDVYRSGFNNVHPDAFLREMRAAKIRVHMCSPPSEEDVISAMTEHAQTRMARVDADTVAATRPHAEKLLSEMDPVDAVAAALAVLSDLSVRKWRRVKQEVRGVDNRYSHDGDWRRRNDSYGYERRNYKRNDSHRRERNDRRGRYERMYRKTNRGYYGNNRWDSENDR